MTTETHAQARSAVAALLAERQGTHPLEREAIHGGASNPREAAADLVMMRCIGGGWTHAEIAADPRAAASWTLDCGERIADLAELAADEICD